jgi:hypothetical protein
MQRVIIENTEKGVFFYHEKESHYRVTEKLRQEQGLIRRSFKSLAEECRVEIGEYMVVPQK